MNADEPLAIARKAQRDLLKRLGVCMTLFVGFIALAFGIWFLWRGVQIAATVTDLLWELVIVVVVGIAATVMIVLLLEGRTRIQKGVMPGADENHSLVDWIGRLVQSRSEKRNPLTALSPQMESIEKDPVAMAILAGLGSIGSGIRALGRYMLMAILFLAIAWSLAPFAASLAP